MCNELKGQKVVDLVYGFSEVITMLKGISSEDMSIGGELGLLSTKVDSIKSVLADVSDYISNSSTPLYKNKSLWSPEDCIECIDYLDAKRKKENLDIKPGRFISDKIDVVLVKDNKSGDLYVSEDITSMLEVAETCIFVLEKIYGRTAVLNSILNRRLDSVVKLEPYTDRWLKFNDTYYINDSMNFDCMKRLCKWLLTFGVENNSSPDFSVLFMSSSRYEIEKLDLLNVTDITDTIASKRGYDRKNTGNYILKVKDSKSETDLFTYSGRVSLKDVIGGYLNHLSDEDLNIVFHKGIDEKAFRKDYVPAYSFRLCYGKDIEEPENAYLKDSGVLLKNGGYILFKGCYRRCATIITQIEHMLGRTDMKAEIRFKDKFVG